jgi:hypothetical protein
LLLPGSVPIWEHTSAQRYVGHQRFSHDDEAWCAVGENLVAREKQKKTEKKAQQEGSGESRQCQEQRGSEAFLTARTLWRQVIYKSNFSLTTEPWSIATLIGVSAA